MHSTCPEERLNGKTNFESNIIFHFFETLLETVSTGCKMSGICVQKKLCREKIIFVNKKIFSFTFFQIEVWQDYQKRILLVQRNVLMLERFRKEYDFLILLSELTGKGFSRAVTDALFLSRGKYSGRNVFFCEQNMFFFYSF